MSRKKLPKTRFPLLSSHFPDGVDRAGNKKHSPIEILKPIKDPEMRGELAACLENFAATVLALEQIRVSEPAIYNLFIRKFESVPELMKISPVLQNYATAVRGRPTQSKAGENGAAKAAARKREAHGAVWLAADEVLTPDIGSLRELAGVLIASRKAPPKANGEEYSRAGLIEVLRKQFSDPPRPLPRDDRVSLEEEQSRRVRIRKAHKTLHVVQEQTLDRLIQSGQLSEDDADNLDAL